MNKIYIPIIITSLLSFGLIHESVDATPSKEFCYPSYSTDYGCKYGAVLQGRSYKIKTYPRHFSTNVLEDDRHKILYFCQRNRKSPLSPQGNWIKSTIPNSYRCERKVTFKEV